MSSGYVGGPSRSAWEGANFWQRRNPATMTHVPMIRHTGFDDALAAYVAEREATSHVCPSCRGVFRKRGYERHLRACSHYHWKRRLDDAIPF